jgi:hypothetical protein
MNRPCDLCLRDGRKCSYACNYVPKYNLCPVCKELTVIYGQRCHKCGYDFKTGK